MQATNGNLEKDGYVVVGPVISASECDSYSAYLNEHDGNNKRALLDEPWCRALSEDLICRLISVMPEIEGYSPVQCTLFQKNKNNNWLVAMHQDKSLSFNSENDQEFYINTRVKDGLRVFQPSVDILKKVIAIRLSLDASHKNNGPLRILAGTHAKGILDSNAMDTEKARVVETVPEIDRGGLLCIRPLLLHASSKSITADQRRVFILPIVHSID